ncbi:074L [Cherax quadricarinatus iridovirus]|uniref:074L n=1 Tax=Cherax quadricarinatus iridovirus TaxID=2035708 RepID=UPI000BC02282|nr:074L [Cherax quadricarinatus iridovirus]ASZ85054.1 074L [Cherax quadricarinatus iridovirus]
MIYKPNPKLITSQDLKQNVDYDSKRECKRDVEKIVPVIVVERPVLERYDYIYSMVFGFFNLAFYLCSLGFVISAIEYTPLRESYTSCFENIFFNLYFLLFMVLLNSISAVIFLIGLFAKNHWLVLQFLSLKTTNFLCFLVFSLSYFPRMVKFDTLLKGCPNEKELIEIDFDIISFFVIICFFSISMIKLFNIYTVRKVYTLI